MEAGRRFGAARRTMFAANLLALLIGVTVGLLLACALLPFAAPGALAQLWWTVLAVPFLLLLIAPPVIPFLLRLLPGRLGSGTLDQPLPLGSTVRAALWGAGSFVCLGAHIAVLVGALTGWSDHTLPLSIGAISLAICVGVLAIPVPAGVGIRDGVLVLVLASILDGADLLLVAVASRVVLLVVDLLLAGFGSFLPRNPRASRHPE
jgi:uncharacterized membrane protein YbhN (UPF0104 family)